MVRSVAAKPRTPAHRIFFPLAALYAACALPLSAAALTGWFGAIPGLATPARHAYEMLFGFGLAAVAGNQLGPLPGWTLGWLIAAWVAARLAFLASPGSVPAMAASALFAALLGWQLVPRVTASVRKWRNRALPASILIFCAVAVVAQWPSARTAGAGPDERGLLGGIVLIALVMFFMSGRIIAPVAAGHLHAQGHDMRARVQPRIEGAVIAALSAAFVLVAMRRPQLAGAAMALAACAAAARLARWKPWRLRGRRDIVCLLVGYAWLVAGMAWVGACLLARTPVITALHLITVGAMGTLTVNVMALTWARLARTDPSRLLLPSLATGLIALATVLRIAAVGTPDHRTAMLLTASGAWSAAYVLLLACFARISAARGAS